MHFLTETVHAIIICDVIIHTVSRCECPAWQSSLPRPTADKRPGSPAAAERVSFSDPLVSSPSPLALPRDGPVTIFLPSEEVYARPGPAAPRPELEGSPVETSFSMSYVLVYNGRL